MKPSPTTYLPSPNGYAQRCTDRTGYLTPVGKLPSVTTIISATKSEAAKAALKAWQERPGSEERLKGACGRGTYLHTATEAWIRDLPVPPNLIFAGWWKRMKPWLEANFHSALGIEFPIWHPAGFSGTADCMGWLYDSLELQLIDWKTSLKPLDPNSEKAQGYFMQLAAYRAGILHTYKDVETLDRASLVVVGATGSPTVFTLTKDDLDHHEREFFRHLRVYQQAEKLQPTALSA